MIPFAASPELQELKSAVQEQLARSSPEVRDWCTADTLQRYLAARKGNVTKAATMLRASLLWREEFQPHKIRWSEIAYNASTGRIELLCETDSLGRPIVVMRLRNQMAPSDNEHQLKYLVYMLEQATKLAEKTDSGRMTWLLEMDGYSPRNSPPFSVTKQSIGILQNHYPERLGWAILSRPPCIFSILWRAINPFLDQDTRDKVVMIKSGSDVVKSLKGVIDASAIDQTMGGTRNGHYDFAAYQERMSKLESEKL